MREHGVALPHERLDRLRWPAANEIGQRLGVVGSVVVHLGREAQREDPLYDDVGDRGQRAGQRTPQPYISVEYGPGGLSLSPDPGRSTETHRKCWVYAGNWNA